MEILAHLVSPVSLAFPEQKVKEEFRLLAHQDLTVNLAKMAYLDWLGLEVTATISVILLFHSNWIKESSKTGLSNGAVI